MKPESIESALIAGDLSTLTAEQRIEYYLKVCSSLGLNPVTNPFEYVRFQGKLRLYARKDATDQLRRIYGVSLRRISIDRDDQLCVVVVEASKQDDPATTRTDFATGAVSVSGLTGDALANAIMRAETKAKRRATLSICGLGLLDESELETVGKYETLPAQEAPKLEPTNEIEALRNDLKRAGDADELAPIVARLKHVWRDIPLDQRPSVAVEVQEARARVGWTK